MLYYLLRLDELKDFALPLMHIVDTLSPNDSHPQAYLTEAARCEWEFSREAIARFPMELETLRDALRKAESAIAAINNVFIYLYTYKILGYRS